MPRKAIGLSAAKVRTALPGRYGDGGGLYLRVQEMPVRSGDAAARPAVHRYWIFRYTFGGKAKELSIGPAGEAVGFIPLAEARDRARDMHRQLRDGVDPGEKRKTDRAAEKARVQAAVPKTFRAVADLLIASKEPTWKNAKHKWQWGATLAQFAHPHLGDLPVHKVAVEHVLQALEPIWKTKNETATRVRSRIEAVLDYATVLGWRTGENPARWRGFLAHALPAPSKIRTVAHQPSLPWQEVPAFLVELRSREAVAALAMEFAILTAARSGEVLGARWSEFDLPAATWTVPASRMKMNREHRVPLSAPALAILDQAAKLRADADADGFVFPGTKPGSKLSDMAMLMLLRRMGRADITVHGFRSSFRVWAAESTAYPGEVAEAALAHVKADKVEAAYQRSDLFDLRRRLMDAWATYCTSAPAHMDETVVTPIRRTAG